VDIKTLFIKNIDTIIEDKNISYFIITKKTNVLYNGIIYTPPKNELILTLLNYAMKIKDNDIYFYNLQFGQKQIVKHLKGQPKFGLNITDTTTIPNIYIYYELHFDKSKCMKLDRWGYCNYIVDKNNEKIIQLRDPNYTPNYI
jgi:hypothetical protein